MDNFKFERQLAAGVKLAELLDETLPVIDDVIVVAVPTIPAHTRQRGYDHAAILAKKFAERRNLKYSRPLRRLGSSHQRGASRSQRISQAKTAYRAEGVVPDACYLLIDDVVTTGATVHYAARCLIEAGAAQVWVAAIARQPSTEAD